FFLCGPTQVTAAGCPAGGTQVGAAKPLVAGAASSDVTAATSAAGRYCWRTEYTPDAVSQGVYLAATHTNATSECFTVAAAPAPGQSAVEVPQVASPPAVWDQPPAASGPPAVGRLQIPNLAIDAAVEPVLVDAKGSMAVPSGPGRVGWYSAGPRPGAAGDAVL